MKKVQQLLNRLVIWWNMFALNVHLRVCVDKTTPRIFIIYVLITFFFLECRTFRFYSPILSHTPCYIVRM